MQTLTAFLALVLLGAPAACNSTSSSATSSDTAPSGATDSDSLSQRGQQQPARGTPQPKLPVGTVEIESPPREPLTFKVEIANTDVQRQMGLMWRETMAADEGMLFFFDTEQHLSFWMRNTVLPLDIIFIDSDWKVLGVSANAVPFTDDPREVPGVSQYVLELNAGAAARYGIGPGTVVRYTPPPSCEADKK